MTQEVKTSRCHTLGHPEFVIEIDGEIVPRPFVDHFVDGLERMVAAGNSFSPGDSFQVGWSILKVAATSTGELTLHEPDHGSMPMTFQPGITRALFDQMVQLFVLDSFGVDRRACSYPSMLQSAVVCGRFQFAQAVLLERDAPTGHASGWLFACTDEDHQHRGEEIELISRYEAVTRSNRVVEWLALPPSTRVLLPAEGLPRLEYAEEERLPAEGSFVAKKFAP